MKYYKVVLSIAFAFSTAHVFAQPRLVTTLAFSGPRNGGSIIRTDLPGFTPGVMYSFDRTSPNWPSSGVIAGDGLWLYGITAYGGTNNNSGTFYRIRQDGSLFTKLYDLPPNSGGASPQPYYHTDGFVYFGEYLAIRKYNTAGGSMTNLPTSSLIQSRYFHIDADDWIYYTEMAFPTRLIKMKTDGSSWTQLHQFNAATEGDNGMAGVTEVPGDTLFGVQSLGGVNNGGTIYSIKKDGTGFVVHHQFTDATGTFPTAKLVYFDGKLYGNTSTGGDFNKGVLFCINADGTNYRVLRHFGLGDGTWTENPFGSITISSDGRIFGSFSDMLYSSFQYFRLYKVDTSGENFEPFFTGDTFSSQRSNGEFSLDVLLIEDQIYFTTSQMGRNDGGVLNSCDTTGVGGDLYHFGSSPDGFRPIGGLIKASDGKLYGTASIGGPQGSGVIYSLNENGTGYTRLKQLTDAEGYEPSGKLLEASDGKLYGACRQGGANFSGCIFRINKNGTGFQVIYSYPTFTGGYSPVGGLVEDAGGTLYGVNFWGSGSVFKINKDGTNYTELKLFVQATTDLSFPYNGVVIRGNTLYGACGYGGTAGKGGLFRLKTDGSGYQVLHEFNGTTDGELPVGTLLLASNGKLYGSTALGGDDFNGFLFSIDTTGTNFTVLRDLANSDGGSVWSGLMQASDGLIYGGTTFGGVNGGGALFRLNLDGSNFTIVKNFDQFSEGASVYSVIDLNGNFTLPVELLSFSAKKRNQTSELSWKTAQEQNSDRFEIERSLNGVSFNLIGTVAASGHTNSIVSYSFTDNNPVTGVNYYRLKQIDQDGRFSYSKIAAVNFGGTEELTVFPNPVKDRLYIRIPGNEQYKTVRIVDAAGKIVLQKDITNSAVEDMNVAGLPKGWYVMQLIGETKQERVFVKE